MFRRSPFVCLLLLSLLVVASPRPQAATLDTTVTDVTTRAFSVVWASDETVSDATVRVYADAAGTSEITGGLSVQWVSQAIPASLALGVVKVDVVGLAADSCFYYQTETTGVTTESSPAAPPFPEICTEVSTRKVNAGNSPIANDLIVHNLFGPDGSTPADGALLLVEAPGLSSHPVSTIVGDGALAPSTIADLANLFDTTSGENLEVVGGEILQLTELRGLSCPGLQDHKRVHYRRAPDHEETATISASIPEAELALTCFFADTLCDDTIDILDAQRVLNVFGSQQGDCSYNPDLDIVADQQINILDVQSVLNRFGQSAPFPP